MCTHCPPLLSRIAVIACNNHVQSRPTCLSLYSTEKEISGKLIVLLFRPALLSSPATITSSPVPFIHVLHRKEICNRKEDEREKKRRVEKTKKMYLLGRPASPVLSRVAVTACVGPVPPLSAQACPVSCCKYSTNTKRDNQKQRRVRLT